MPGHKGFDHRHGAALAREVGLKLGVAAGKHSQGALIIILGLCWPIHYANASNLRFLENSVVSRFDETDWKMFREATAEALNNRDDGSTVSWRNDQSEHSGTVTPLNTTEENGFLCRRAKLIVHVAPNTRSSTRTLCKDGDVWKVAR